MITRVEKKERLMSAFLDPKKQTKHLKKSATFGNLLKARVKTVKNKNKEIKKESFFVSVLVFFFV